MIHIYISEKTHHLPLENKLSQIPQIFATPHRNSKTKHPRPIENPHGFFLITPRKSTSCLIDSGISACFFQHPLKFNVLNSPCLFFFWNRMVIKNMFGQHHFKRNSGQEDKKIPAFIFFMLRQLKTTNSLRDGGEVAQNLAISEANLYRGSTKHRYS